MDNPIKYTDLFDSQLEARIGDLKKELEGVQATLNNMVASAKTTAEEMKVLMASQKQKANTKTIQEVYEAYKKMKVELTGVTAELEKLQGSSQAVALTQKEINKVVKLGTEYNSERENSYAQLSKKYSAMKILINQLTQEERENTEEGRRMVQQAKEMYEQMNQMQQATGKFQLQVGNYAKATNGLRLATNQIVRELPVLSNGLTMFVMAISNNVPIFIDEMQKVKKANKEALESGQQMIPLGKTILKAIFSWQSAIVLVLTLLPSLIKSIQKRRKEIEKMKEAIQELVKWEKEYADGLADGAKEYINNANKLIILNKVTRDETRTLNERYSAAKKMQDLYPEVFSNFSAEEIAVGKADIAYQSLTKTLLKQANAQAYLNKLTELQGKIIDIAPQKAEKLDKLEEERLKRFKKWKETPGWNVFVKGARKKDLEAYLKALPGLKKDIDEWEIKQREQFETAKEKLYQEFVASDLLIEDGVKATGGKVTKKEGVINKDLEIERRGIEQLIRLQNDGYLEEKRISDEKYDQQIQDKLMYIAEQEALDEKDREVTVEGLEALQDEVLNLIQEREQKAYEIRMKWLDKGEREWEKKVREHEKKWKKDFGLPEVRWNPQEITKEKEKKSLWEWIGFEDDKDGRRYMKNLEKVVNLTFKYMEEWMDKRIEMAHIAVESAEKEANAAKEALDIEQQARANGYAHNVGLARKEYEEKLKAQQKAMAEEQRLAKIQQDIDTAQQISSLLVATANLWANYSKMPILGQVLAGIATASMFGAFAMAKIKANEVAGVKKYGEGMSEYLDYGGSHASGNDIDFGTMKDGTKRRVEKGEMVAVINKRNVNKYGVDGVADVISSLNSGTFEDKYGLAFAGLGLMNATTDLTELEDGMKTLVKQGEKRVMEGNGYRVEYYKNRKRIIKN